MDTEILDVTQCEEQKPRRKTLAVITSTMANNPRAEMLSLLTVKLADRGWDITIITHNRQGFYDFLVDERVHRYSMDKSYHKNIERPERLRQFVEDHPEIDHYLFWDPRMSFFAGDFEVINEAGKHTVLFFKDSLNEAINCASAKRKVMSHIAMADATITGFPLDNIIYETTYIPYLHPYAMEDQTPAKLGKKELLLLTAGSSVSLFSVVQNFVELLENDESFADKRLRIVPINKNLSASFEEALAEILEAHPKNIFLEELCEKPHKRLDGYAGAILINNGAENPQMLSHTIAKGLPTLFVKGYADYSIQNFNKGFRICHANNSEKLQAEIKRFFDPAVNKKRAAATRRAVGEAVRNEIVERWENVLLGNEVAEYEFATAEHVLKCAMSYVKYQEQKWLDKFSKAALYNSKKIVKKAKSKAAAMAGKGKKYPLLRFGHWYRVQVSKWAAAYHRWEKKKFMDRSFIDTDMATRKKVQYLILKLYIEFERICKENGYRFYIAGGTLLGAVRHKGFIPWDDDLDVVMPRKDYDAFLKNCSKQLRDGFVLNAHAYPYTFTRLEIIGPRTTAPLQRNGRNIFLDILPLDCAAPTERKKEKHAKRSDKLRNAMMDEAKLLTPIKWADRKAIFTRAMRQLFCPYSLMIKKWTRNAKKYQSDNATHWVCLPGDYGYEGESFTVEDWGEPVMMEFEGLTVPAMNNWELYLTEHYGEYMLYPPVSQRSLKHKIYSIDLERYENMSVEEIAQELSDDYFASTGKRISFLKEAE